MALPPVEAGAPNDGYGRPSAAPAPPPSRPTGQPFGPRLGGTIYPPAGQGGGRHLRPDPALDIPDGRQAEIVEAVPAQNPNIRPVKYADDLFWIMFDDRSGRLVCQRHVAGLGLAAAMLVELVVGGWVTVEHSMLRTAEHWVPPRDVATHVLLDQVTSEPVALTVRQWLEWLSKDALDRMLERLVRAQVLIREERQRTFRSPVFTYTAANNNNAAWPRARLSTFVRQRRLLEPFDLVLTALCDATGLLHIVLEKVSKPDRDVLLRHVDTYLMDGHRSTWAIVRGLEDALTTNTAALA